MYSIQQIFNNSIFRIPDYQRGYSWEKSHLEDFWQDLINLQLNKIHYTGMISVEEVKEIEYNKWNDDLWIITGKGDKAFFIVDGQQRLTTIIIMLWTLLKKVDQDGQLGFESKDKIIDKYIYSKNEKNNYKSYIFGYHKDNPSYEFLKREIFEQVESDSLNDLEETSYTNNLLFAKRYFLDKIKDLPSEQIEALYKKVTQQLKFDYKILDKELDIFVVFETMNNRGKPLSNLEKLKNRLIYLSTLLKEDDHKRAGLRNSINDSWQIVYSYLGKNKENMLDDDLFLQNHWIMYERYERREAEFYANDLFERKFTANNVIKGDIKFEDIYNYIESVSSSVKQWFVINNPSHPHSLELIKSKEVIAWLEKQDRLGYKSFAPLTMAVLALDTKKELQLDFLKAIESYVFLIFYVSNRRSNTGSYHFNAKASEVYNGEISVEEIIKDINYWIYGDSMPGYFEVDNFYSYLKDLFVGDNFQGFTGWKWLRYFLFEYEVSLNGNSENNLRWDQYKIIEHILPLNVSTDHMNRYYKEIAPGNKGYLLKTLGNLILTTVKHDPNLGFEEKKPVYANGTKSEFELSKNDSWSMEDILQRGQKLLNFMEDRWSVKLGNEEQKRKLLFMDFID